MKLQEAIEVIKFHATDPKGANLLMRNGDNPGVSSLKHLSDALKYVFGETARSGELRRDIAFSCGIFLQFKKDHRDLMKQLPESEYDELMIPLMDVSQWAFEVLAGENAADWGVEIPKNPTNWR